MEETGRQGLNYLLMAVHFEGNPKENLRMQNSNSDREQRGTRVKQTERPSMARRTEKAVYALWLTLRCPRKLKLLSKLHTTH